MWVGFATHIFSKNISMYAILNDQSFNDTLTNNIISFEQLDPDHYCCSYCCISFEPSPEHFAFWVKITADNILKYFSYL